MMIILLLINRNRSHAIDQATQAVFSWALQQELKVLQEDEGWKKEPKIRVFI